MVSTCFVFLVGAYRRAEVACLANDATIPSKVTTEFGPENDTLFHSIFSSKYLGKIFHVSSSTKTISNVMYSNYFQATDRGSFLMR